MVIHKSNGLIAAPFTPMHPDGSLHLDIIPSYYHFLKANGVRGAFVCGSTGEGVSLTVSEKMKVAEAWASSARGDADFLLMQLLGGTCLQEARDLAVHARQIGFDAVSITAPFYFKPPSVDVLAEICMDVAAAVPDVPLYYYHIPVLTGVYFSMYDLLHKIDGKLPNFAGVKYTHEDFMDFSSCLHFQGGKYDMLWGRDENLLPALSLGAQAAVGSTFNYAAPLYHDLMQAYASGEYEAAARLQQQSIDMIRLLGKYGGIATGKAYMKLVGMDCGAFRLPVKNMDAERFAAFTSDAEALGFRSFMSRLPQMASK